MPGLTRKLGHRNTGPYTIIRKISPVLFIVDTGPKPDEKLRVNVKRLIPYYDSPHVPVTLQEQFEEKTHDSTPPLSIPTKKKSSARRHPKTPPKKLPAPVARTPHAPRVDEIPSDDDTDDEQAVPEDEALAGPFPPTSAGSKALTQPAGGQTKVLGKTVSDEGAVVYRLRLSGNIVDLPASQVPRALIAEFEQSTRAARRQGRRRWFEQAGGIGLGGSRIYFFFLTP